MFPRLKTLYKDYRSLPPISVDCYIGIKKKATCKTETVVSLKTDCLKDLPWNLPSIEEPIKVEAAPRLYTLVESQSKSMDTSSIPKIDCDDEDIEIKYRNFDSTILNLHPSQFPLLYRDRMNKLKWFQTYLAGQTYLLINDSIFLDKVKNRLEFEEKKFSDEQLQKLAANDLLRERYKSRLHLSSTDKTIDKRRKLDASFFYYPPRLSVELEQGHSPANSNSAVSRHSNSEIMQIYVEAKEDIIEMNQEIIPVTHPKTFLFSVQSRESLPKEVKVGSVKEAILPETVSVVEQVQIKRGCCGKR